MKTSLTLEKGANIAIILAAVALVGTSLRIWLGPPAPPTGGEGPHYGVGDVLDLAALQSSARLPTKSQTLAVFVNSSCTYCTKSMGFYRRLVEAAQISNSTELVFVSRELEADTRRYLESHDIGKANILMIGRSEALGLRLTPTVLLVDGTNKIQQIWSGLQQPDGESGILAAMGGGPN